MSGILSVVVSFVVIVVVAIVVIVVVCYSFHREIYYVYICISDLNMCYPQYVINIVLTSRRIVLLYLAH